MTILIDTIELPDLWIDPDVAADSGLKSVAEVSRANTLIIREAAAGFKKMDLIGSEDSAWIEHDVLMALRALADAPGGQYVLNLDGEIFAARFRNWEGQPAAATPVVKGQNPQSGDLYNNVRIRLVLEI